MGNDTTIFGLLNELDMICERCSEMSSSIEDVRHGLCHVEELLRNCL